MSERPLTVAERLTEQFYQWELRGRGWRVESAPVALEPPFRPFFGHFLTHGEIPDDGRIETFGSWLGGLFGNRRKIPPPITSEPEEPEPEFVDSASDLVEFHLSLPPDYEPPPDVFAQFLSSLAYCQSPLAFEVIGTKAEVVAQLVARAEDGDQVQAQLKAHFPEVVIETVPEHFASVWPRDSSPTILEFGLDREFMIPLHTASDLAVDPLVGLCGALGQLRGEETAIFQVLFQPVRHRWAESMWRAVTIGDGESFFENAPELVKQTRQKLAAPLYAVVVRVAARAETDDRQWELVKSVGGALRLFGNPQTNELQPLDNAGYPDEDHKEDLLGRVSRRGGMILNRDELAALAHLPGVAVRSRKLKREVRRTKELPAIAQQRGVVLGENVHEGITQPVSLATEQRLRHLHLVGASGTGKSSLLLNLIHQDICSGQGVAVLDPHGDLIDTILETIPVERYGDVVLFDPADEEYPVGFNLLSAHSNLEKTLLASDLVAVFRRLSTAWGDQMTSVLGNAILAFLESSQGGTLPELRRFLMDESFRASFLPTVQDPEVVYFWEHEFALANKASLGSLLTRLDTFLRPKAVRYLVGQRENKVDFARIMGEGKILLAKLSQGLIGEENSYLLGSLLVAKFHQLAIARQQQDAAQRRPFFIHLDEFHHFICPSLGTILAGARKYGVGLTLAHQSLQQLQRDGNVGADVLANTYARVCFRVSDDDAKKLAEGFGFFAATDLQNLANFEAICRVEKKEWDFNLRTLRPPEPEADAAERRATLQRLSRERYGTPRQQVEEELARSRQVTKRPPVDPFAKRAASVAPIVPVSDPVAEATVSPPIPEPAAAEAAPNSTPEPPPESTNGKPVRPMRPPGLPPEQGRGGAEHRYHQQLVKQMAEGMGWRADIEHDGVDVLLSRGLITVACEISRTNKPEYEVGSIRKRLNAGVSWVCLLAADRKHRQQIETLAEKELTAAERAKVRFLDPGDLADVLGKLATGEPTGERTVKGRRVKTTYKQMTGSEGENLKDSVSQALRQAWQRFKK